MEKFSNQNAIEGIVEIESVTAKITKIAFMVLVPSFFFFIMFSHSLSSPVWLYFFCVTLVLFGLSYIFTNVMLFVSKKPNSNVFLSLLCYIFLGAVVIVALIMSLSVLKDIVALASAKPNNYLEITQDVINQLEQSNRGYIIAIVVLSSLLELSMLISFKVKKFVDIPLAIFTFVVYLVSMVVRNVSPFILGITVNLTSVLILEVYRMLYLFFALENRTKKVKSLIFVDENGKEIDYENQQRKVIRKSLNKKHLAKLILTITLLLEIGCVILSLLCLNSKFIIIQKVEMVPFMIEVLLFAFIGFFCFYNIGENKISKKQTFGSISLIVGLIFALICATFATKMNYYLLIIMYLISVISLGYGVTCATFLKPFASKTFKTIRGFLYVLFALFALFIMLCFIFSPDIVNQIYMMTPYFLNIVLVLLFTAYFIGKYEERYLKYYYRNERDNL